MLDSNAELHVRIKVDKDAHAHDSGYRHRHDQGRNDREPWHHRPIWRAQILDATKDQRLISRKSSVNSGSRFIPCSWWPIGCGSHQDRFNPEAEAVSWYATGEDNYQISGSDMSERGTKIEIKLKEDASEFAENSV
ncbi:hypothetical protein [Candidatus Villigracilis affinis]|uniref:hypothetical protein n=1 Tax=Candidatus Villigracilis affinis TaxID=3140682 RepID=UPI002A2185E7|nr:hypothetical protein [Anaerolineales bacterium]